MSESLDILLIIIIETSQFVYLNEMSPSNIAIFLSDKLINYLLICLYVAW